MLGPRKTSTPEELGEKIKNIENCFELNSFPFISFVYVRRIVSKCLKI